MRMLVLLLGTTLLAWSGPAPTASAAAPTVTALQAASPPAHAGAATPVGARATDPAGVPLAGATISFARLAGGAWTHVGTAVTNADGLAVLAVAMTRNPADNVVRASYAGDAEHAPATVDHALTLVPRPSHLRFTAPRTVVDETTASLGLQWTTDTGEPVAGQVVVQRKDTWRSTRGKKGKKGKKPRWRTVTKVTTAEDGTASLKVMPRRTFRWRAVATGVAWADGTRSKVRRVRNLPPMRPILLPRHAPRPRIKLPPQRRAVGDGPHAVVRPIPAGVWSNMVGRSWHRGCPVGRAGLRLLQVNYWGYDGYRHRGELVVNAGAARNFVGALSEMYHRRLPIRAMYRVDRFGWSPRLNGANDYASMASGNTSAFNCRSVVNNPGVRSPHSWGRSLDVNTWENPYRSRTGLVPNAWWQFHSHPRYAWRSSGHTVVSLMRRHGFRWTYGLSDTQHFDAVGGGRRLRALLRSQQCGTVCD